MVRVAGNNQLQGTRWRSSAAPRTVSADRAGRVAKASDAFSGTLKAVLPASLTPKRSHCGNPNQYGGRSGCADQRFEQADQCRSTIPRASQAAASTMAGPVTMTRVSLCSWLMLSASMGQAWVMAVVAQNRRGTRSAASVDGYSLQLWSKPGMGSSSPPSPARPRKTMRSFTPAYLRTNRSSARMMAEESSSLSPAPISAFICWAMSAAPGRGVAVSCALSMTMAMSLWCSLTLNPGL